MKKTNKVIVIIIFVVVILFGVGQFFAFSPSSQTNVPSTNQTALTTSTAENPAAPATQVIAYAPPALASSTSVKSGSCWTNSIAAPFRADAWRCMAGNNISDPCFTIPGSTSTLLCNIDPTKPASTSTFVLKLTQPLPKAQPLPGPPPSNWAWLVQLSDGTLCSPFTGAGAVTASGESASYDCAPGPLGKDEMIFGDLNNSSTAWTAEVETLSTPTSSLPVITSSSTVTVSTVWQ